MYNIKSFILFLLIAHVAFGQKEKDRNDKLPLLQSGIKVIVKAYGDSIVLRWAPTKPWAWHKLNVIGYKIERVDLSVKDHAVKELLTPGPLKPYTLEKFKTVFKPGNNNAAIAAQCLYGKNFNTNLRTGQAAIQDKASVSDARFAYTLMAADFDAEVGVATALRFADRQVKKGGTYMYRIMPAAVAAQGRIDTGIAIIVNVKKEMTDRPEISESLAYDRLGELHWGREDNTVWSGFYIERSDDGKTYKALNELPFISSPPDSSLLRQDSSKAKLFSLLQAAHIYVDSLPQNYKNYYYRIRGINAFAELSDYSNPVTISGRDLTPPVAVNMLTPEFISDRKIRVTWHKPVIEKDCKGYFILRAKNINGPYETLNQQLLPVAAAEYIDNNAFAHGAAYYIVTTMDTANNVSMSSPAMGLVPDNTPPAIPTGLKGRIDKNGLVYLSWNANPEEDIKGYKVYFANAADHIFTQVTTGPDSLTGFIDSITLRTLTKNIWYKIVAVDYNNNHSEFSQPVQLRKPDIIPPTAPVATHVNVSRQGVEMDWIQSSSSDVVSYAVYRKEEKNAATLITQFNHNPSVTSFHFRDTTVRTNTEYSYTAEAIDEDSLHSPASVPVQVRVNAVAERPAITSLKAIYNRQSASVALDWQYTGAGDYFFIIYRGAGNDPLQRLQSLSKEETHFSDLNIETGKKYRYAVQAIFRDGKGNTAIGESVSVVL